MPSRADIFREGLKHYLPEAAVPKTVEWLAPEPIHLHVNRPRTTRLGDFRPPDPKRGITQAKITVNNNLNRYAFLITLTHEFGHYLVWKNYKKRLQPHGVEWQDTYRELMSHWLGSNVFPHDLEAVVIGSLGQVRASTCADPALYQKLKEYDKNPVIHLQDLPEGSLFVLPGGRLFRKGPLRRSRFLCEELDSKRKFAVSGVAEVRPVQLAFPFEG